MAASLQDLTVSDVAGIIAAAIAIGTCDQLWPVRLLHSG
jgi:hypothetical protein